MAGKKSLKGKGYYAAYKALDICKKNRAKKLARHVKANPADAQVQEAVKAGRGYIRDSGKAKRWSPESRWLAQVSRELKGFWNQVYNSNGKFELLQPQPEFINFGDKVEVAQKDQKPKNKNSKRPKKVS